MHPNSVLHRCRCMVMCGLHPPSLIEKEVAWEILGKGRLETLRNKIPFTINNTHIICPTHKSLSALMASYVVE